MSATRRQAERSVDDRRPGHRRRRTRGFTLLELVTVIVIIAVLSGIAVGAGRHAMETGRIARAKAELATLAIALAAYQRVYGDYPRTDATAFLLQALLGKCSPVGTPMADRPLIDRTHFMVLDDRDPSSDPTAQLIDPWGQPYRYAYRSQSPWTNSSYVLWSVGPDGQDSGGLLAGGYPAPSAATNLDNVYANRN